MLILRVTLISILALFCQGFKNQLLFRNHELFFVENMNQLRIEKQ